MHDYDDHETIYQIVKFIASGSWDQRYRTRIKIFCLGGGGGMTT